MSVGVGLGVLHELLEAEVVGPKGRHNPDRNAVRHGHVEFPRKSGHLTACALRAQQDGVQGAQDQTRVPR